MLSKPTPKADEEVEDDDKWEGDANERSDESALGAGARLFRHFRRSLFGHKTHKREKKAWQRGLKSTTVKL